MVGWPISSQRSSLPKDVSTTTNNPTIIFLKTLSRLVYIRWEIHIYYNWRRIGSRTRWQGLRHQQLQQWRWRTQREGQSLRSDLLCAMNSLKLFRSVDWKWYEYYVLKAALSPHSFVDCGCSKDLWDDYLAVFCPVGLTINWLFKNTVTVVLMVLFLVHNYGDTRTVNGNAKTTRE